MSIPVHPPPNWKPIPKPGRNCNSFTTSSNRFQVEGSFDFALTEPSLYGTFVFLPSRSSYFHNTHRETPRIESGMFSNETDEGEAGKSDDACGCASVPGGVMESTPRTRNVSDISGVFAR